VVLTKRQISMIAVLGASVIGFIADRAFLDPGTPKTAEAAASWPAPGPKAPGATAAAPAPAAAPRVSAATAAAPPTATAPAKPATASQAAAAGATRIPLAERLKTLDPPDGEPTAIREAFAPSAAWLASLAEGKPSSEPQPDSTADFVRTHKLTSVLRRGSVGSAIIDGKVVEVGEHLNGYCLIGLTADSAVFRSPQNAKEVRLSLIGPSK